MRTCVLGVAAMIACVAAGGSFSFVATNADADWGDPDKIEYKEITVETPAAG